MSSDDWSFNLRTGNALSDDECDDNHDGLFQNSLSNEADFIRQIDLSSRQDNAEYKPNPWSIAKVNAACRPKPCNPHNPTDRLAVEKPSPSKGAIVDAFKRQAKSRPKITQSNKSLTVIQPQARSNIIRGRNPPVSRSSVATTTKHTLSHVALPSQSHNSDTPNASSCGRLSIINPAVQENAHIVDLVHTQCSSAQRTYPMSFSPHDTLSIDPFSVPEIRDINAPPIEFLPDAAPISHTLKCFESDSCSVNAVNDRHRSSDFSSFAPQLYDQDEFYGSQVDSSVSSLLNEHHSYPSALAGEVPLRSTGPTREIQTARASIDRLFDRDLRRIPGRQVLSSPPVPTFYSSYHQTMNNMQSRSSPTPLHYTAGPSFLQMRSNKTSQMNSLSPVFIPTPTTQQNDHYPSGSRKRKALCLLPEHSPLLPASSSAPPPDIARVVPKPSPARRQESYDHLPASPDSQWSTIRNKKRPSTKAEAGVKTSGKFRLPLSLGSRAKNSTVAGNKARVITYLPSPKKKTKEMAKTPTATETKKPVILDPAKLTGEGTGQRTYGYSGIVSSSFTHCLAYCFVGGRQSAMNCLLSPPPSDDLPVTTADAPAVVFDVEGVVHRYRMVRQGLRMVCGSHHFFVVI
jgi:hypothetical protein